MPVPPLPLGLLVLLATTLLLWSIQTAEPAWLWWVAVRYVRFLVILIWVVTFMCIAFDIAWLIDH